MNIALFTDTYPPEINGVATSSENLRKTLVAHGHQVLLVTTNPFSNKIVFKDNILRIPGINLKKLYGYLLSYPFSDEAMRYIVDFHPDIVHSQTDMGIGMFGNVVASRLHLGIIYTYHTLIEDYAYYVTKGHFDRAARQIVRGFYRRKLKGFDETIAPSDKIYDYLRSIGIDGNVSVIPTGIEFDRFAKANENKAETMALKQQFGIAPNDYVILSLGRIAKEKSIDVLLRGYAKFLATNPSKPTKFVVTGWGPAEDELKELALNLGISDHVIFTGKVAPDKTQIYYHLGDAFASASVTETQGLTFMEAMAASLVVLARYDDNLVGTIKDGETGFFFLDENDFGKKLEQVIRLSKDGRNAILTQAMDAIEPYSMEHFYQSVMEVYQRVVRRNW